AQDTQGVTINGIARTHQARVEVRQSGQIIYTAPVNAGAFTLESTTRVVLSANPKEDLARIYNKYVNHSDYTKERREDVLARELK
ncbi:fimbria/pilus outer membrane usher protein, partial [Salmonella enterica subsp. enterica serovar Montevideo]|nr:fimbria/pilus outer membrane usher protein [Salmonella enterica subsp. enterica serovar Montevideo]